MKHQEDIIQAECYQWFRDNYPQYRKLLFAVPNGGKRDRVTASILKATGTESGIPDLQFNIYGKCYGLECKKPGGIQSQEQIRTQEQWVKYGNPYYIFQSLEEFKEIILTIIL